MRNPLKAVVKDLTGLARATAAASQETERRRRLERNGVPAAGRPTTMSNAQWLARTSFPIYREWLDLPPGTELHDLRPTKSGTVRTIELPSWSTKPVHLEDIRHGHARFTDGGIPVDRVRVKRRANPRLIDIYTITRSAFDGARPSLPPVKGGRIPLGFDVEAETRYINTSGNQALHTIVAGITGSGKTNTMKHLMACYAELGWEVWLGDPTGGSEFFEYLPLASTIATSGASCSLLLAMAADEIERRYEELGERRLNFWDGKPLVIFVDELPLVLDKTLVIGTDDKGKDIKQGLAGVSAMRSIVMRGRRAAVTLVVGIQSPRAEDMSGAARSQFPYVICHKVARTEESRLVLGEGSTDEGMDAKRLPFGGRAYLMAPGFDTDQVQVWEARKMSELGHLVRDEEPTIVSVRSGSVPGGTREGDPGNRQLTLVGTTAPETGQDRARKAQKRLAEASASKWAEPILDVLGRHSDPLGPTRIANLIGSVDGETAHKGRILSVLRTLAGQQVVEQEGSEWRLSDTGRELLALASIHDFYGEDEDEDDEEW